MRGCLAVVIYVSALAVALAGYDALLLWALSSGLLHPPGGLIGREPVAVLMLPAAISIVIAMLAWRLAERFEFEDSNATFFALALPPIFATLLANGILTF